MSQLHRKQIKLVLSKGPANSAYGVSNVPGITNADQLESAVDKIVSVLDKLAPTRPKNLGQTVTNLNGTVLGTLTFSPVGTNYHSGYAAIDNNNTTNQSHIATATRPLSATFVDKIITRTAASNTLTFATPSVFPSLNPLIGGVATPIETLYQMYIGDADTSGVTLKLDDTGNLAMNVQGGTYTWNDKMLTVEERKDYWTGTPGKSGFWNAVKLKLEYLSQLTPSSVGVQTKVSDSKGNTATTLFFVDEDGVVPTVAGTPQVTLVDNSSGSHRYVSGVYSPKTADQIDIKINANNVAKFFYPKNPIVSPSVANDSLRANSSGASVTSSIVDLGTFTPGADTAPVANSQLLLNPVLHPNNNRFNNAASANNTFNYRLVDVFGTQSVNNALSLSKVRFDLVSNEATNRFYSTVGSNIASANTNYNNNNGISSPDPVLFSNPAVNGIIRTTSDDAVRINDSANTKFYNELQLENGVYRYPSENYLSAGYLSPQSVTLPNYSGLTNARMATFKLGTVANCQSIYVRFPGITGTSFSTINGTTTDGTSKFKVFVKISGATASESTNWLDATTVLQIPGDLNFDNGGVGPYGYTGAPCLDPSKTNTSVDRYILFVSGLSKTFSGDVFVRVYLDSTAGVTFQKPAVPAGGMNSVFTSIL